jgi:hypothetical protein
MPVRSIRCKKEAKYLPTRVLVGGRRLRIDLGRKTRCFALQNPRYLLAGSSREIQQDLPRRQLDHHAISPDVEGTGPACAHGTFPASGPKIRIVYMLIGPRRQGPSAVNTALCHALQSAASTVSIGLQDALAGDEGLAQTQARAVQEAAILPNGM